MTEPYEDPQQIDKEIYGCILRQRTLEVEYRDASKKAAENEAKHKTGFAKARVEIRDEAIQSQTKVTEGSLEDAALVATEDSYSGYRLSAARADALKQAMLSVRSQLDGLRSLAANHRTMSD